jgi:hypothetical protein
LAKWALKPSDPAATDPRRFFRYCASTSERESVLR